VTAITGHAAPTQVEQKQLVFTNHEAETLAEHLEVLSNSKPIRLKVGD
jgi:hypothetical protein